MVRVKKLYILKIKNDKFVNNEDLRNNQNYVISKRYKFFLSNKFLGEKIFQVKFRIIYIFFLSLIFFIPIFLSVNLIFTKIILLIIFISINYLFVLFFLTFIIKKFLLIIFISLKLSITYNLYLFLTYVESIIIRNNTNIILLTRPWKFKFFEKKDKNITLFKYTWEVLVYK